MPGPPSGQLRTRCYSDHGARNRTSCTRSALLYVSAEEGPRRSSSDALIPTGVGVGRPAPGRMAPVLASMAATAEALVLMPRAASPTRTRDGWESIPTLREPRYSQSLERSALAILGVFHAREARARNRRGR